MTVADPCYGCRIWRSLPPFPGPMIFPAECGNHGSTATVMFWQHPLFMPTPTHDEISLYAQHLWQDRGCPDGRDTEIWLEAERKLSEGRIADAFAARAKAETAAESEVEYHLSPAETEQKSIQAAMQKEVARAQQVPHHLGPKAKPAETGKPLWTRPHGS